MRILLAEDDLATRKGVALYLRDEGHQVHDVGDGAAALAELQRDGHELVLSDMRMPGLDGMGLLARMRECAIDTPVIVMTAYATVEEAVQALHAGAEDYLTKPLNLDELGLRIARLAGRLQLRDENRQLKDHLRRLEFPAPGGRWQGHAGAAQVHRAAGRQPGCAGDDLRRKRYGQGTGGAHHPRPEPARRPAVFRYQLRRSLRRTARERAVRPSQGRLHRSFARQARAARICAPGYVVSRRSLRDERAPAEPLAALSAGTHVAGGGLHHADAGWMRAWSARAIATWPTWCAPGHFAKTSITG